MIHKISTERTLRYVALEFATGLVDLELSVRKPDGSLLAPAPEFAEQGEGVYEASYTPDVLGLWQEKISSVSNGDRLINTVNIVAKDIGDVSTEIDGVDAKVDTVDGKVDGVDAKVVAVDTKVTTVDGKADTIVAGQGTTQGKVDVVDGKVAVLDGKADTTHSKLDAIDGKVDGISGEIKPGGYLA